MILCVCARLYTCNDNARLVGVSISLPNSSVGFSVFLNTQMVWCVAEPRWKTGNQSVTL